MSQLPNLQCPAALIAGLAIGLGGLLTIQLLFAAMMARRSVDAQKVDK